MISFIDSPQVPSLVSSLCVSSLTFNDFNTNSSIWYSIFLWYIKYTKKIIASKNTKGTKDTRYIK
jgi:hypothetical protein